ncbi:hypothetical protein [Pseudomonas sp. RIT-PI-S]|uniref:hypothetical protein n=1 Tax=Pseudomonas sp. RIT-PI-S TaxID=3035295 RepID=UPI0021D8E3A5|nr:hypothetical protein [Pseudomonas sp. RIT-PI-S]
MPLPRSLAWPLCLVALCTFTSIAVAAAPSAKHAHQQPQASKDIGVSLLAGKLRFKLPEGYQGTALPPGDASTGTAGAQGTLYMNEAQKRIVVATQIPLHNGTDAGENDDAFLAGASAGFLTQQAQALPDFHKTLEKRVSLGGLEAQQIDATATMGGGKTLSTYFITGAGQQMAVVQVISRESDRAGHEAMVQRITAGAP